MTTVWTFLFGTTRTTYLWVFIFGCLIGAAELTSRHSDHRFKAMMTPPSLAYLVLNGTLSVCALVALDYVHPEWAGYDKNGTAVESIRIVLIAGFGAAAFFRSSLFKLKTPDGEIAIGPALIIDVFLQVIDESVDRTIGQQRLIEVSKIMADVDFDKAAANLPTFCFASLRRLAPEAQRQFAFQLKQLADASALDPKVKAVSLGLAIMSLTGKPVLSRAVDELGPSIKIPKTTPTGPGNPVI